MDWVLMRTKVNAISSTTPWRAGIRVPDFYFDPVTNRVVASAQVDPKEWEEKPVGPVRAALTESAEQAFAQVSVSFLPRDVLSLQDFEMKFVAMDPERKEANSVYVFAEFKDGKLILNWQRPAL